MLKFCPFCGSTAIDPTGWVDLMASGPKCQGCGATAESVEAWNRRPKQDQPPAARDVGEFLDSIGIKVWEWRCLAGPGYCAVGWEDGRVVETGGRNVIARLRTDRALLVNEREHLQQIVDGYGNGHGCVFLLFDPE